MVSQLPLLVIALAFVAFPSSVRGALFPATSNVKHVDTKAFRQALKEDRTFIAAFVAPWCGHCQKLAPELIRAADGLHPLVPVYAVDCDNAQNKPLCAEQDVKGFPTIKLFPRGKQAPPLEFDGTRTASSLFYWASQTVPHKLTRTQTAKGVTEIVAQNPGKPKAVLMNKSNKIPLLWRVLSNKYGSDIVFVNCRDRKGKESVAMGFEAGPQSQAKVLVYSRKGKEPVLYEGILKLAALSEFFDQVIDGSIDISRANLNAKEEVLKVPESERKNLDDETRIGDAGYAGFNPHENLDMEELMRHGIKNPHAAAHPGAANPHAANPHASGNAGTKAESESVIKKSTATPSPSEAKSKSSELSSSVAEPSPSAPSSSAISSSSAEEPSSSVNETPASKDESSAKNAESTTKLAEKETSVNAKGSENAAAHTKDEL